MSSGYADAVKAAIEAVAEMAPDDPLRAVAFQEVLRAVLSGTQPMPALTAKHESSSEGPAYAVATRLGLSVDQVHRVFDFAGEDVNLTIESAQLPSSKSGATEQIALLVCAARQGGLGEADTSSEIIRRVCDEFARYDDANFASTLRGLTGLLILGGTSRSRTYRITRPGYERVRALIEAITTPKGKL